MKTNKTIIGRTTKVRLPLEKTKAIPAKVDTGADSSSIWASQLHIDTKHRLHFVLFDKESDYYTGYKHIATTYKPVFVRSSNGSAQVRYRVQLSVKIAGRKVRGSFTLSDRSKNTYPILIGCKLLNRKFLVDVSRGKPLAKPKPVHGLAAEIKTDPHAFFKKYHGDNQRGDVEL